MLIRDHATIGEHEAVPTFACSQLPHHCRKSVHAVVVARAAKRGQTAEQRDGLWRVGGREAKSGASEFGHDGEARVELEEVNG